MAAGYDPKKAETYNKLIKQGVSEEAAQAQAGISDNEATNYVIDATGNPKTNPNYGTMGAWVDGWGKSNTGAFQPGVVEKVPYNVAANNPSSTRTVNDYTSTSTTQSGGKAVFIAATKPKDTEASLALQPQIDAKQAELSEFAKNNPSNFARKVKGLPPMTPEEFEAREKRYAELSQEKLNLQTQQAELKTSGEPARFETPNTTTNTTTTTYGTEANNTPVESPDAQDPAIAQQADLQLALNTNQIASLDPVPVNTEETFRPGESTITTVTAPEPLPEPREAGIAAANDTITYAPAPGTSETFRPEESTITVVEKPPGQTYYEAGGGGGNQGTITRVTTEPQDVPPTEDPAAGEADSAANPQQSTITGDRGGNEAQNQAAMEQRLKDQQAIQAQFQSPANGDWRVKLKLPPSATYLYKDTLAQNGILAPLAASDGVVFPYMPEIQTTYNANYDTTDLTHSNYRGYFYKNSYVGDIGITGVFTAQNTQEANYLLAVIHFFRSATKMFYGSQDSQRGTPPPLVYLFGLGQYQFNAHPCVIRSFNYNLPNDVDYIRTKPNNYNVNLNDTLPKTQSGGNPISAVINRLRNALLPKGALPNVPQELISVSQSVSNIDNSTYVPTKITVQINLLPIQTRNQQSQQFSVKGFANGDLLKEGFW
jgi:hypothetical protein